MISTVIVVSSLLMATLFTAAYLLSPAMRAKKLRSLFFSNNWQSMISP